MQMQNKRIRESTSQIYNKRYYSLVCLFMSIAITPYLLNSDSYNKEINQYFGITVYTSNQKTKKNPKKLKQCYSFVQYEFKIIQE